MKVHYLRLVRRAFRALRNRRLRNNRWWQIITKPLYGRNLWVPCRDTVASGMAIGMFFSMMLMPCQMLPAALIAMRTGANVPTAMAACWITNPLTMAPILYGQFRLGKWMREALAVPMPNFLCEAKFEIPAVGMVDAASFILGMITSGVILALLAYPMVQLFARMMPHHLPKRKKPIRGSVVAARQSVAP